MRVEIQERMIRMQRLPRTRDHKATVATTLRLAGGVGMGELQIEEERRPRRVRVPIYCPGVTRQVRVPVYCPGVTRQVWQAGT